MPLCEDQNRNWVCTHCNSYLICFPMHWKYLNLSYYSFGINEDVKHSINDQIIHLDDKFQLYKSELRHWLIPTTFFKAWISLLQFCLHAILHVMLLKPTDFHSLQDRGWPVFTLYLELSLLEARVYILGSSEPKLWLCIWVSCNAMKELLLKIQLLHHHSYSLIVFDMGNHVVAYREREIWMGQPSF